MNIFERTRYLANERLKAWASGTTIHRPERTLVIIDMQKYFSVSDNLIPTICGLIQHAKQNRWAIILVKFQGSGPIFKEILETIKDYPNQATVTKSACDGGREIIKCINDRKSWSLDLLVCGVYGDECVSETVAGLFNNSDLVEVDVITDAIYPPYMSSSEQDEHGQQQEREVELDKILTGAIS